MLHIINFLSYLVIFGLLYLTLRAAFDLILEGKTLIRWQAHLIWFIIMPLIVYRFLQLVQYLSLKR